MRAVADREARLRRKYNITLEQWHILLGDGRCPACLKLYSNAPTRLPAVDHDHETGLVRGILCVSCNNAIGYRHDDAGWFRRVAEYLEHPPALLSIGTVYVPDSPGAEGFEQP